MSEDKDAIDDIAEFMFSPEQKRRAFDLVKPDHNPALELEEIDELRRKYRRDN